MHIIHEIHENIINKLNYFYEINKIPNIIFHGPSGSGKKTILHNFINTIYNNDKKLIKNLVLYVNCAHGKGIKFIREELKFFAKTNIYNIDKIHFKSIILYNADNLTIDAQSALRRCIELFCHSTRFFIIVENKFKLLKPILSRFCEFYINEPYINDKCYNLYEYHIANNNNIDVKYDILHKYINQNNTSDSNNISNSNIISITNKIYEKGFSSIDIIHLFKTKYHKGNPELINNIVFYFYKIKSEFRNEKLLIMNILYLYYFRLKTTLENISII